MSPWLLAIRPKTLPAAVAPVLIGTAMAYGDGMWHWPSALAALFAALMIQIGTNLVNDYCDFKKGADHNRVGPVRVTQAGLVSPQAVVAGAAIAFMCSALACVFLMLRGGYPILIIGIVSILSGIFYTAGRRSLGYLGLGDIFAFVFFGPVAVGGTYYVQALDLNMAVVVAGFAPGFLSAAILTVNNLRDMDGDRRANKRTLAVRFGRGFACSEYVLLIFLAAITPLCVGLIAQDHKGVGVAAGIIFYGVVLIKTVFTSVDPKELNDVLAKTGLLLLLYSMIFSLGWVLCSRL